MNKKILVVSALILILTVMLTACKGKKTEEPDNKNTDKIVNTITVTGPGGGVTNVEIFEDESGDRYITNVDGEKIPFTTDKNGFGDDINYLVTSKPSPSNTAENSSNAGTPAISSTEPTSNSTVATSSSGGIIIGNEDETKQDTISIDEIKNQGKNP